MPLRLLEYISGKITTEHFNDKEYICRKGDKGLCMYIIYKGEVEIIINDRIVKVFNIKHLVGRTALETEGFR